MKKILAITIMALFLFSLVPAVFAEESDDSTSTTSETATATDAATTTTDLKEKSRLERVRMNEERKAEMAAKLAEREGKKAELEEKKEERKAENEAKKAEREQLREQLKTCKEGQDTSECKTLKSSMKKDVKERLLDHAEKISELINDLKNKVETLNPKDKATLIAGLDARLTALEATKVKINALTAESTKEEVKAVTKELQDQWTSARKSIRLHATRMMATGFERVLVKAEKLEARLQTTLDKLKAKGFDTALAQPKVDEFKTHIADSRKSFDEAKVLLDQYRVDPSKENAVSAIQEKMKEAKKHLQLAQENLREALKEVKKANEGAKVLAEESSMALKEAKEESEKLEAEDAAKVTTEVTA